MTQLAPNRLRHRRRRTDPPASAVTSLIERGSLPTCSRRARSRARRPRLGRDAPCGSGRLRALSCPALRAMARGDRGRWGRGCLWQGLRGSGGDAAVPITSDHALPPRTTGDTCADCAACSPRRRGAEVGTVATWQLEVAGSRLRGTDTNAMRWLVLQQIHRRPPADGSRPGTRATAVPCEQPGWVTIPPPPRRGTGAAQLTGGSVPAPQVDQFPAAAEVKEVRRQPLRRLRVAPQGRESRLSNTFSGRRNGLEARRSGWKRARSANRLHAGPA